MSTYPTRRRQRLEGFDYTTAGCYFVTVCVQDRLPLFGRVVTGTMQPSPAAHVIEKTLSEIPSRFPGVDLDTVMVMPDHVHLILTLGGESASLSEIMHWFKAQSTARYGRGVRDQGWRRFNKTLWQRGFYDRIIRDDEELNATATYMLTNPERWMLRHEQR